MHIEMPFYNVAYEAGVAKEAQVLPILLDFFKRDIKRIQGKFSQHDFEDETYTYELKSRSNRKNTFPDTIITTNKFENLKKPLILLFCFTDYLCCIKYNPKTFEKYEIYQFARTDRADAAKLHIKIPVKDLIVMHQWNPEVNLTLS